MAMCIWYPKGRSKDSGLEQGSAVPACVAEGSWWRAAMFVVPHGDKRLLQSLGEFIQHNGCKLEVVQLIIIERVEWHCCSTCEHSETEHLPIKERMLQLWWRPELTMKIISNIY